MNDPLAPIFEKLREHYDAVVREPLPQRILDAVKRLQREGGDDA